ncbi:hypothetical protein HOD96_01165 [Candidatus Falkowbacteria bacterium]|mgnify:CR=1 FL=1|jgi:hypothetical protein|nr:hypothetical protein [Candidatus Falkowbacteria bacterium]MBT4432929.1 hypothetical protein [Candidatus Falkowbacteria bacterium]
MQKILKTKIIFIILSVLTVNCLFLNIVEARLFEANSDGRDYYNLMGEWAFGTGETVNDDVSIMGIVAAIINAILSFFSILFLVMIIYGGHMWMFSRGNEEQVGKAKKILINSTIGGAIVLLSWAITIFIFGALGY